MSLYRNYIKPEWVENIRNYKFKANNSSIMYKYFSSPLAERVLEYIPTHVAPNVITLTGFVFIILLTLLIHVFSGSDGKGHIPGIILLICGIFNYTYYTLDNCDGKQARRTKNSTPLGMLVDHNLDSLTTVLLTIAMVSVMGVADSPWGYLLIFYVGMVPFFLCTWEELHVGSLNLPCINGADEGNHIFSLVMIFTAFVGQDFWKTSIIGVQLNTILLLSVFATSTFYSLLSIRTVVNYYNDENNKVPNKPVTRDSELSTNDNSVIEDPSAVSSNIPTYFEIVNSLSMFIVLTVSIFLVFLLAGENSIVYTSPKIVILAYGFSYVKLLIHVMMGHIAHAEYEQWRTSSIATSIVLPLSTILYNMTSSDFFNSVFYFMAILNFCVWFTFAVKLSNEFCTILNIRFFKIKDMSQVFTQSDSKEKEENYIKVENLDGSSNSN